MENEEFTWQDNVVECAQRLSRKIEEAFLFELRASTAFLPEKHIESEYSEKQRLEDRIDQMEILFDYTLGTTVALLTHHANLSPQFEQNLVAMMKDKFRRLRELKEDQNANQSQ